jgi:glutamate racemase
MEEKPLLGIFDSGVGGFSVFREIRKESDVDIVYYGDCARAPYGNRSEEEIVIFIKEIINHLQSFGVTHFVSACNSMSVVTTEKVLREVGVTKERYVDMIDAVRHTTFPADAKVLIIGTQATITSGVYQAILEEKKIAFDVFCPRTLAGNIEQGNSDITIDIEKIMSVAVAMQATHILYACTHYPLVGALFVDEAKRVSWTGIFVDPAHYVAMSVMDWKLKGGKISTFETSLETDVFKEYREKMKLV